jgi:multidrug resistance efflux pump
MSVPTSDIPAPQGRRRSSKFSGTLRISTAMAFLGLAGWYGLDHAVGTVSDDGVLTAPILKVHAQMDGVVSTLRLTDAVVVEQGEILAEITQPKVDTGPLEDLSARLETAQNAIRRTDRALAELDAASEVLAGQVQAFEEAAEARLAVMVTELDAEIARARATLDLENAREARVAQLARGGNVAAAQIEEARAAKRQAEAEVARLSAAREGRLIELQSARAGTYLNQGYFETPYSRQRLDEITMRRRDLAGERAALADQVVELEKRLALSLQVTSPTRGLIWAVHVTEGSEIVRGTVLAEIAACTDPVVEVAVSEAKFSRIRIGDSARVRLTTGGDGIGHVRSVRMAAASDGQHTRASAIGMPGVGMMTVSVSVTPEALAAAGADACQVGRTAKVFLGKGEWDARPEQMTEQIRSLLGTGVAHVGAALASLGAGGANDTADIEPHDGPAFNVRR